MKARVWLLLVLFSVAANNSLSEETETEDFLRLRDKKEEELVTNLESDSVWRDESQKGALNSHLQLAQKLRSAKVISILVEHIDYSPYEGEEEAILPAEKRCLKHRFSRLDGSGSTIRSDRIVRWDTGRRRQRRWNHRLYRG